MTMSITPVIAAGSGSSRYYTLKNQRFKITQLEKAHFIKVNELKLTEIELV